MFNIQKEPAAAREELLALLQQKSVSRGRFTLSSGAQSDYYLDCRLTTLHPIGAWLVGLVMFDLIQCEAAALRSPVHAVGGLTMGADPIALSIGMTSCLHLEKPIQTFVVRKAPKAHGQTKLIEGNFNSGDVVVVLEDVITTGESALKAIDAVHQAGGKVAFVAVLVDRQEGGRARIEECGYKVVSAYSKDELLSRGLPA